MLKRYALFALALALIIGAVACSDNSAPAKRTPPPEPAGLRSDQYTPTPTPRPTEPPVASSGTPGATSASGTPGSTRGTPVATPGVPENAIIIDPPDMVAKAQSGEQIANQGSSFWQHANGLMSESHARGIELHTEPLTLNRNETVSFGWQRQNSGSDTTLKSLKLQIYSRAENTVNIETQRGTFTAFKPTTAPVAETNLDMKSPTWNVNVPAGEYFIFVRADWSNPRPDALKERYAEYGFMIEVK